MVVDNIHLLAENAEERFGLNMAALESSLQREPNNKTKYSLFCSLYSQKNSETYFFHAHPSTYVVPGTETFEHVDNDEWEVTLVTEFASNIDVDTSLRDFIDNHGNASHLTPIAPFMRDVDNQMRGVDKMVAFDTEGRDSIVKVSGDNYVGSALTLQVATQTGILIMQLQIQSGEEKRELHPRLKAFLSARNILLVGCDVQREVNKFKDFKANTYDIGKSFEYRGRGLPFIMSHMFNLCITMWNGSHNRDFMFWTTLTALQDRRGFSDSELVATNTTGAPRKYFRVSALMEQIGYDANKYLLMPTATVYAANHILTTLLASGATLFVSQFCCRDGVLIDFESA